MSGFIFSDMYLNKALQMEIKYLSHMIGVIAHCFVFFGTNINPVYFQPPESIRNIVKMSMLFLFRANMKRECYVTFQFSTLRFLP